MTNMPWQQLKQLINSGTLPYTWIQDDNSYVVSAFNGPSQFTAIIPISDPAGADQADFEANYKALGNQKITPTDSNGVALQRLKVTSAGWSLHYHGIDITTSKLDGVIDLDHTNADTGFATISLYDGDGTPITNPLLVSTCVKTVVDWEPNFSFDIIGGDIHVLTPPVTNVRASVMGVPDIPPQYGGSKVFMTGFNLKFVPAGGIQLDGKTPKSLTYVPGQHLTKIRIILFHDPGVVCDMLVMFDIFKA